LMLASASMLCRGSQTVVAPIVTKYSQDGTRSAAGVGRSD
jgi:hypothetical protein